MVSEFIPEIVHERDAGGDIRTGAKRKEAVILGTAHLGPTLDEVENSDFFEILGIESDPLEQRGSERDVFVAEIKAEGDDDIGNKGPGNRKLVGGDGLSIQRHTHAFHRLEEGGVLQSWKYGDAAEFAIEEPAPDGLEHDGGLRGEEPESGARAVHQSRNSTAFCGDVAGDRDLS